MKKQTSKPQAKPSQQEQIKATSIADHKNLSTPDLFSRRNHHVAVIGALEAETRKFQAAIDENKVKKIYETCVLEGIQAVINSRQ